IVTSTDTWFRPSDICVAPDGSVFISDWYDPGVGGHGMGDTTRGRIYRLAPKGNKPGVAKVDLESLESCLTLLGSPAQSVRYMAMSKLEKDWTLKDSQAVKKDTEDRKANRCLAAGDVWERRRV